MNYDKNTCAHEVGILKGFFASTYYRVRCRHCGVPLYRSHVISAKYLFGSVYILILAAFWVVIKHSAEYLPLLFLFWFLIALVVYVIEIVIFKLEPFDNEVKQVLLTKSKRNALIGALVIVFSVMLFLLES